jgi:DNA/RNA-binding domain of Phe-tRNA-synthetase-like protein
VSDVGEGIPAIGEDIPEAGWLDAGLQEEFAGLALRFLVVPGSPRSSTGEVKAQLASLANRYSGGRVVNLRHQPIPWAYRVFFRHVGLDPDADRTPVEQVALERMRHGGFQSENLVMDALTIAVAESGVALRAFDADSLEGRPGIRPSRAGEQLAGRATPLEAGTLVIADEARALGLLFGIDSADHVVSRKTRRVALLAVQVAGVPDIAVEEAMWLAAGILRG